MLTQNLDDQQQQNSISNSKSNQLFKENNNSNNNKEKLKQLKLESSYDSSNKLRIDVGLPPIDFSKILKESNSLIEVEYQSAYSVVLRGNEETLLLVNGTLAPFWYAIDIVKKHGYQLKEITESGMGTQGNPTRFYAVLEK